MRIIIFLIALSSSVVGLSQDQNGRITSLEASGINLYQTHARAASLKAEGSPYPIKSFSHAKAGDVVQNAFVRYNACDDEFEFINSKNDTLILNKGAAFSTITTTYPKAVYQYVNYTEKNGKANTGYLINLYEKGGYILYKRQKINFYAASPAKSSYDTGSAAKFVPVKDTYFLKKNDGEISELPINRKGFLKLFPEKKEELETFIKQNDISFEKEQDFIRLIDFLAR